MKYYYDHDYGWMFYMDVDGKIVYYTPSEVIECSVGAWFSEMPFILQEIGMGWFSETKDTRAIYNLIESLYLKWCANPLCFVNYEYVDLINELDPEPYAHYRNVIISNLRAITHEKGDEIE